MNWLVEKRRDVLRRWKANEICLAEAASELTRLGMSLERAWDLAQRT